MDNRRFALCHARFFVAQMPETALRIYQTKEELEADQKADAEKAEREERLRREQEHQKKCERLEQTYDGTMSSLKEFTKSFYYDIGTKVKKTARRSGVLYRQS